MIPLLSNFACRGQEQGVDSPVPDLSVSIVQRKEVSDQRNHGNGGIVYLSVVLIW